MYFIGTLAVTPMEGWLVYNLRLPRLLYCIVTSATRPIKIYFAPPPAHTHSFSEDPRVQPVQFQIC